MLIIGRFHSCDFACSLKFIFNHMMKAHWVSVVICRRAQVWEARVPDRCPGSRTWGVLPGVLAPRREQRGFCRLQASCCISALSFGDSTCLRPRPTADQPSGTLGPGGCPISGECAPSGVWPGAVFLRTLTEGQAASRVGQHRGPWRGGALSSELCQQCRHLTKELQEHF